MENNWFQEELTHLEHLAKIVPDSPVVASMLSTFLTRMKANQCWTSQAIVALLGQATNIQLPEPMHKQLMETIQSLQCATGGHMKLANAGQHVQATAKAPAVQEGDLICVPNASQPLQNHALKKLPRPQLDENQSVDVPAQENA